MYLQYQDITNILILQIFFYYHCILQIYTIHGDKCLLKITFFLSSKTCHTCKFTGIDSVHFVIYPRIVIHKI